MKIQNRDGRRGAVFSLRLTDEERSVLEDLHKTSQGPRSFGPWLVWRALGDRGGTTRARGRRRGNTPSSALEPVIPRQVPEDLVIPRRRRIILDLCAGSGAWSEPYKRAGYKVIRVTLPKLDVRTWRPPSSRVWGVLCAPPCNEFSLLKNGHARDLVAGMETVNACLRIVQQTDPQWWALENPVGKLSMFLGTPVDVFDPCDFGDPWTKRTALWGKFTTPKRGPFVKPIAGKLTLERTSAERARTPAGFARAFFEANP